MTDFLSMTAQQVEGLPEAKAQEVLEAWVKAKKPELPQALAQSSSKAHVKLARKAIYRLQSSGVAIEPEVKVRETPPVEPAAPRNEFPAVLSMQLGTGERAFLCVVPIRSGGLEVFNGIVSDEFGLAQLGADRSNRNLYRKKLDQLKNDPSSHVMLVPIERIKLELGRAMTLNERSKTPLTADIEQSLSRLGVTPEDPDFPIPPPEPSDVDDRESGAAIHQLFELEQWLPSEKDLRALTAQVDAIRTGPLPLSDEQKEEKIHKLARELAAEVFTAPQRLLYARRLWYTAEVIDFFKRPADAAKVRAEARRLAHETVASRFAERLFEKALPAPKQ